MNTLLISYDLGGPETSKDYEELIKYLRTYGTSHNNKILDTRNKKLDKRNKPNSSLNSIGGGLEGKK